MPPSKSRSRWPAPFLRGPADPSESITEHEERRSLAIAQTLPISEVGLFPGSRVVAAIVDRVAFDALRSLIPHLRDQARSAPTEDRSQQERNVPHSRSTHDDGPGTGKATYS